MTARIVSVDARYTVPSSDGADPIANLFVTIPRKRLGWFRSVPVLRKYASKTTAVAVGDPINPGDEISVQVTSDGRVLL